jgi:hypothetical protein
MVTHQVHGLFRVFSGASLQELIEGAVGFLTDESSLVAPKSIGVTYIAATQMYVLSVGYQTDEQPGYKVTIKAVPLGEHKLDGSLEAEMELEDAMEEAAAADSKVICHELFVDEHGEFGMVFMSKLDVPQAQPQVG